MKDDLLAVLIVLAGTALSIGIGIAWATWIYRRDLKKTWAKRLQNPEFAKLSPEEKVEYIQREINGNDRRYEKKNPSK